jgi:hypothetical protein
MRVDVTEVGNRPLIATAAKLNAPQGAKVLADVLVDMNFAEHCLLVLDWEKGALVVSCAKRYPDIGRRADIDFALDMEDAFQQDNFSRDIAIEMMDHLRSEFQRKDDEAKRMEGRV